VDRTPDPISRLPASPPPCEPLSLSLPLLLGAPEEVVEVARDVVKRVEQRRAAASDRTPAS